MHITILTAGSRGDVQPYVALGAGLQGAGHQVRLATHAIFEPLVRQHGLEFARLEGDPQAIVQSEDGQDWLASGRNPFGFIGGFRELMGPVMGQAMRDAWDACQGTSAVLVSGLGFYAGQSISEKLGVPLLQAYLQPIHPTSAFPSAIFPTRLAGHRLYNFLTHLLGGQFFWQVLRPAVNKAREELLGLPRQSFFGPFIDIERRQLPVAYGFSPAVIPRPRGWGPHVHICGYWFLETKDWNPPRELEDFIAAGSPPVYVGFGSMASRDAEKTTHLVLQALQATGRRGILLTGWGGLSQRDLPGSVYKLDSAPHEWLFPRMAAVVHHGGAGTTAAGLRAGIPSILVPFYGDQFFWGARVAQLGVGPRPIDRKQLTAGLLADAIRQACDDAELRARSTALGEKIRAEDGIGQAVRVFNQALEKLG